MGTETKIAFRYERETKNKYRFKEDTDAPVMGTVYVSKDLFEERPEELEITLRVTDQSSRTMEVQPSRRISSS